MKEEYLMGSGVEHSEITAVFEVKSKALHNVLDSRAYHRDLEVKRLDHTLVTVGVIPPGEILAL